LTSAGQYFWKPEATIIQDDTHERGKYFFSEWEILYCYLLSNPVYSYIFMVAPRGVYLNIGKRIRSNTLSPVRVSRFVNNLGYDYS
jgi:hypothetical protein